MVRKKKRKRIRINYLFHLKIKRKINKKKQKLVMRKLLLSILLTLNGLLAVVFSVISVDWLLGGGCTRSVNYTQEPAFLSHVWRFTSYIYTWAPENTIWRSCLFIIAFVITIAVPIVLALYFGRQFQNNLKKYREL